MMTKPSATPMDAFLARHAEIDALLTALQAHADDHFGVDPDEVQWGHVGNLGHVAERLREIAAFCGVSPVARAK